MKNKLTYYLFVLGCQMNASDAERLSTILESLGYKKTDNELEADLIGVVSCAVRQAPMDRIYGKSHQWDLIKEKRPLITLLTGCVLKTDKEKLKHRFDILLDMKDIEQLPELIKTRHAQIGDFIPSTSYLQIKPTYESKFKAYVPIMTGCNKFCSYCAVPYTRGPEISRPSESIIAEVEGLIGEGYKEITLLGQNVNSYGNDSHDHRSPNFKRPEITFPELLHKLNKLPGDFWLRYVTSHPYDMSDELIQVMAEREHLTEYLHLPVQSGSNEILKKMNRLYTIEHYLERLETYRKYVPESSLSTDVIVGFAGETEKQFNETAKLMQQVDYDMAYIAQYSPRPGTGAARAYQDDVPKQIKKQREKILVSILEDSALKFNKKFIGKTVRVLVDGQKKNELFGKNREFKTVRFPGDKKLIGEFVDVNIQDATAWNLIGKLKE